MVLLNCMMPCAYSSNLCVNSILVTKAELFIVNSLQMYLEGEQYSICIEMK